MSDMVLVTTGDGEHAEAQHGRERVDHLRPIAPVARPACIDGVALPVIAGLVPANPK